MQSKINASIDRLKQSFDRSRGIASIPIPIGTGGMTSFNSCETHVDTPATVPEIRVVD